MTTDTTAGGPATTALLGGGQDGGQQQPNGGAPPAPVPDWAKSYPDDLKQVVTSKHWKEPTDAVRAYGELNKLFGAEKAGRTLALPGDADPPEAWNSVWDRLGRPQDPAGYQLDKIEGVDPELAKDAAKVFHEAGVPRPAAERLAKWFVDQGKTAQATLEEAFGRQSEQDMSAVRREWGQSFDARQELARRAVRTFIGSVQKVGGDGSPDPSDPVFQRVAAMERAWGTRAYLNFWADIGERLGEDKLPGGQMGGAAGGVPGREAAKAELERLEKDPENQKRLLANDKETVDRMDRLYRAAYSK